MSIGVPGREVQEREVDVPAGLADEGLVLVEVDHGLGRQAHVPAELVEIQSACRTTGIGRELIEHPGVEEEVQVVGDGEGLGDAAEVLATDLGLARLPPLVLPVAGGLGGSEDRQPGIAPQLTQHRSERVDGVLHRHTSSRGDRKVTPM